MPQFLHVLGISSFFLLFDLVLWVVPTPVTQVILPTKPSYQDGLTLKIALSPFKTLLFKLK